MINETRAIRRSLDQLTVSHHAGPLLATLLRLCGCFVGICANFGRSRSDIVEVTMSRNEDEMDMEIIETTMDDVIPRYCC